MIRSLTPVFIMFLSILPAVSQESQTGQRSATNIDRSEFPRVDKDRRVTFHLNAPNAQSVQLMPGGSDNGLGSGPFEMMKDADGNWMFTTEPAVPGFHYYWFVVDGVLVSDQGTYSYFGYNRECSGVEVPDPNGDFYAIKDVPHGALRSHWYHSSVTGRERRAVVYTPPNYDNSDTRYPVLYLQHGSGEDELGWAEQGKANFIVDNLLAAGKCEPLIVVMENGMIARKQGTTRSNARRSHNEMFPHLFVQDLVPEIDRAFRTKQDRDYRAIAGLSMGAGQAARIGLSNTDKFCYVGLFSGGRSTDFQSGAGLKLLWAGAGELEIERVGGVQQLVAAATAAGVPATWHVVDGTSHEWQTWRYCLREFAPLLFK